MERPGSFQISDLPNGYLLIRCSTHEAMQKLLFDGSWAVNGIVLQLVPWKPYFKPAFTKLSTAALWVQLHNLPVEFWEGEALETISSLLGRLLRNDDFTASLSRSKYARICVEIDLAKPLKQGFWIGDEDNRVFVVVLYECLPTFCYLCGLVGHGSNSCNRRSPVYPKNPSPSHCNDQLDRQRQEVRDSSSVMGDGMDVGITPMQLVQGERRESLIYSSETDYGPWMLVSRRCGRGGGNGGVGGPGNQGSRVVLAISRDKAVPPPNVSRARNGATWSRRGGHTASGRGGDVRPKALGQCDGPGETSKISNRVDVHNAQETVLPPNLLLESGLEKRQQVSDRVFRLQRGRRSWCLGRVPRWLFLSRRALNLSPW